MTLKIWVCVCVYGFLVMETFSIFLIFLHLFWFVTCVWRNSSCHAFRNSLKRIFFFSRLTNSKFISYFSVAVNRLTGDFIVTERSPTHQIQIYNQYGQFLRKFGANILQHPRGVCVDHKGHIIVIECKVSLF